MLLLPSPSPPLHSRSRLALASQTTRPITFRPFGAARHCGGACDGLEPAVLAYRQSRGPLARRWRQRQSPRGTRQAHRPQQPPLSPLPASHPQPRAPPVTRLLPPRRRRPLPQAWATSCRRCAARRAPSRPSCARRTRASKPSMGVRCVSDLWPHSHPARSHATSPTTWRTQPSKSEKEWLRPLYQRYHDLKAMITTLELAIAAHDGGGVGGGSGECAARTSTRHCPRPTTATADVDPALQSAQ